MSSFSRNVPLLAGGQALMTTAMSVVIITSSYVGEALADNRLLYTLPVAAVFIAITLTSIPAAMFMEKFGRKTGFIFSTLFGISGATLATYSIVSKDFWLFVVACVLMGMFNGFGNYFRFAAADAVDKEHKSRAIALVIAGGVVAAIIGANLVNWFTHTIAGAPYAGAYAALIVAYILALVLLSFLRLPARESTVNLDAGMAARPLIEIIKQPKFVVALVCAMFGYGVMSFVMTATPLAMKHHSHLLGDSSFVIQWHMLAMFAPSFFTGHLIRRFGVYSIMFIGGIFGLVCVAVNLAGVSVWHFLVALVFLGLSWNFLFTGATALLTETYHPSERGKAQAFNDFIVFAVVSLASLSAGALNKQFGWETVNYGVIPLLLIILISIIWIAGSDPDK